MEKEKEEISSQTPHLHQELRKKKAAEAETQQNKPQTLQLSRAQPCSV